MEKKFQKTTFARSMRGAMEFDFFSRLGNGKTIPRTHMQSHRNHDFLLGRHLQDPCVGLWKSVFFVRGGVMKKTIRKSTCKAMETLTLHAASICKIHAYGHGNLCFFGEGGSKTHIMQSYGNNDLLLGRHLKDQCVRLWSYFSRRGDGAEILKHYTSSTLTFHAASQGKIHAWGYGNLCFFRGGWHEKTCLKSKCSAIETFTFHSASICKIHAWGYGNAFFWRKGDGE